MIVPIISEILRFLFDSFMFVNNYLLLDSLLAGNTKIHASDDLRHPYLFQDMAHQRVL
jgi:hypothetical protein